MSPEAFRALIAPIAGFVRGKSLDAKLQTDLNETYPPGEAAFQDVFRACREAVAAGWMCNREAGGIKFGRVIKPGPETHGFSVDVVEMKDIEGPHHRHPNGEIDMIMPLDPGAKFDGHGQGWRVYGANSAHSPTVSGGRAIVLYLLPQGAIEFTAGR